MPNAEMGLYKPEKLAMMETSSTVYTYYVLFSHPKVHVFLISFLPSIYNYIYIGDGCDSSCQKEIPPPPVCGDGRIQSPEQCDDGNTVDTDGCTSLCKNARCGDSLVRAGVEECDDGNALNTDDCTNSCNAAKCGDGYVRAGVEECDDGNLLSGNLNDI